MEIITCMYYIILHSAVLFPYLTAKPFSLNDFIEAEDQKAFSNLKTSLQPDTLISQGKKVSSSNYRKTYQIRSPLKPKQVKYSQNLRNKRKNPTKRDYYQYGPINQKYIPILRNLGVLFDNILSSDSSDTDYTSRYEDYSNERKGVVCECAARNNPESSGTQKKAVTTTRSITVGFSTENTSVAPVTTTAAYYSTDDNFSRFRRNKNVPVLLTGDTAGLRGNNNGFSERSSPTYNRSFERHVSRDHGNNERFSGDRERASLTEDYKEDTDSNTRDDASSYRSDDRSGRVGARYQNSIGTRGADVPDRIIFKANETIESTTRNILKHEGKIELKDESNKTKSSELLPELTPGLRRLESHDETNHVETNEIDEENIFEITFNNTYHKQFFNRDGYNTSEDQTVRRAHEAVVSTNVSIDTSVPVEKYVMIFDGYSVARDVNGKNTLTERAITLRS